MCQGSNLTYTSPKPVVPGEWRCVRAPAVVNKPRKPEVAELGVEGSIEHNIAWFNVSVQNPLFTVLMYVQKCGANPKNNIIPTDSTTKTVLRIALILGCGSGT